MEKRPFGALGNDSLRDSEDMDPFKNYSKNSKYNS